MIILGIETSCDETAIGLIEAEGSNENIKFSLLSSSVNSQIEIHKQYGGVVPMLAKREHLKNLLPILIDVLHKNNMIKIENSEFMEDTLEKCKKIEYQKDLEEILAYFLENFEKPEIDLIAITVGPGLEPALWTGIKFAEQLSKYWQIPQIAVNHMQGHIASVLPLENTDSIKNAEVKFPALALLISGAHTELIHIESWLNKTKIGETQDDAIGEAFDKTARMLGLPYPGGPKISKLAKKAKENNIKLEINFPRPMIHSKNLDFSFSGLKTAVLYYINAQKNIDDNKKMAIAREFEEAVTEVLIYKLNKAIEIHNPKSIIIGGGVIANEYIRENILKIQETNPELNIFIPTKNMSTDNAVMIAMSGYISYINKEKFEFEANGNLDIGI